LPRETEKKKRRGQRDMSLPYKELRFEAGAPDHGVRLDAFLTARVAWRSRANVQRLIDDGLVSVLPHKDPQAAPVGSIRTGLKLRDGQEVVLRTPEPGATAAELIQDGATAAASDGEALSLPVLFEDEWILAVDKPPGISVHPSKGHLRGSLIHRIHVWQRATGPGGAEVATLCHRLDRDTSGVVLAAKEQLSRTRIGKQFEARTVVKTYLALVAGEVAAESGTIDLPLGSALTSEVRLKMAVRYDSDGLPSLTEWSVVRRVPGRTLLELRPRTGRQHQLRVHLAAIGHPIVGDKLYLGGEEVFLRNLNEGITAPDRALLGMDRQALHAWKLEIEHPMTGRPLVIEAPLAADIRAALEVSP